LSLLLSIFALVEITLFKIWKNENTLNVRWWHSIILKMSACVITFVCDISFPFFRLGCCVVLLVNSLYLYCIFGNNLASFLISNERASFWWELLIGPLLRFLWAMFLVIYFLGFKSKTFLNKSRSILTQFYPNLHLIRTKNDFFGVLLINKLIKKLKTYSFWI